MLFVFGAHYKSSKMPFGLLNAPATLQRLMQRTMGDFILEILLVYLYDILIYLDEHLRRLEKILTENQRVRFEIKLQEVQVFVNRKMSI